MKNSNYCCDLVQGLVSLGGAALLIICSGCAGTQYSRSTGEYIDDHSLQLRVDHALNVNPDYKFNDVTVVAFKGTIQLNGFVDTADQKEKAGDIVKDVPGVREADNNITVEDNQRSAGEAVDDKALASRVRETLQGNPEYKFDDVAVAIYRGTIQLSGFVDTSDQKSKAADIVRQVAGAKDVQNNIMAKDKMKE